MDVLMADLLHPDMNMKPFDYLQKRHRKLQELIDQFSATGVDDDRGNLLVRILSEMDDLSSVEDNRIFPAFASHDLLGDAVQKMREQQGEMRALGEVLGRHRFHEKEFSDAFDRFYRLVVNHFEIGERELLPLANRILNRQEKESLERSLDEEISRARPAA